MRRVCPVDDAVTNIVLFTNQDEVDRFGRQGCTEVPGGVMLTGDIQDLSPLQNLSSVGVSSVGVSSVGVSSVGVSLVIFRLTRLETLSGLRGLPLAKLPGELLVMESPLLRSLEGLESISRVGSGIWISDCPVLQSLEGLQSISSAAALRLAHLPQVQDLHGLRGLKGALTGGLVISDCGSLISLDGLEGLSELGSLQLAHLANLRSLASLGGLRGRMPGGLNLGYLDSLGSLEGLHQIWSFGREPITGSAIGLHFLNSLMSLRGLRGLRGGLDGGLIIFSCPQLVRLEGLEGVKTLGRGHSGRSLWLAQNPNLESLRALGGLKGTLPGSLEIEGSLALRDLEGLQGISGVCSEGPDDGHKAIHLWNCPSLETVLGLRGLRGPLQGKLWLEGPKLQTLAGLEGLTGVQSSSTVPIELRCPALQSMHGLSGLTGNLTGTFTLISNRLQDLGGFAENLTLESIYLMTSEPICGGDELLKRLRSSTKRVPVLQAPSGEPARCRSCSGPCGEYAGRHMTCDILRGGCRCPLGRAGPGCPEAPVLDVALPPEPWERELEVRGPQHGRDVRREPICVPIRRTHPATGTTAVRLKEKLAREPGSACHSLRSPLNNLTWSKGDPTRGCLWVDLEVRRSPSPCPPLRLVVAYEDPGEGRYPDHLVNGTLQESSNPWDRPWPECLLIGTCTEEQKEVALTVHFVNCPENMEPALRLCVAKPGFWALEDGRSAVRCPFSPGGVSTCLGRNRCAEGFEGEMCAACPVGQVQESGSCSTCGSSQGLGFLCVLPALIFLAVAAALPHLLSSQRVRSCLRRGDQDRWAELWTKLRMGLLKLQELLVWSWGFLLLFPEVKQHLWGVHAVKVLAEVFSSFAFPTFLQCSCGVDVFGEFGILVLAPTAFILAASGSACWPAWRPCPGLSARSCRLTSRCRELWYKRSGLDVLFLVLRFTFSPLSTVVIVHAPVPGVGFHCLGEGDERSCFFRRDYRIRLDSDEYTFFWGWWLLSCVWLGFALLALLLCLRLMRTRGAQAGAAALLCSEFKPERASFEIVNLLRQVLLAGVVLLFQGGSLPQLFWSFLISGGYLALLLLVDPYRNRGDHLLQSFNTIGGMVVFTALIMELVLVSSSAETFFDDAVKGWAKPLLHMTVSAVLLLLVVAPFFEPVLRPTLRRFAAWLDKLKSGVRGNEHVLDPRCEYESLVLQARNSGDRQDREESLCDLILAGLDHMDKEVARQGGFPLPEGLQALYCVTYVRRFRLEEFLQPGNPDHGNRHWMLVFPGTEPLTQATVQRLLGGLSNVLEAAVGRGKRRPVVCVSGKRPELLRPARGIAYHSFILLRERKPRPPGPSTPSTKQLLELGIQGLSRTLEIQELEGLTEEQGRQDRKILERLEAFKLQELPVRQLAGQEVLLPQLARYLEGSLRERHVMVRAAIDRSLDHEEVVDLPGLLRRPFELACLLRGLELDPDWSLRTVTRFMGPEISYPQLLPVAMQPQQEQRGQQVTRSPQPQPAATAPEPTSATGERQHTASDVQPEPTTLGHPAGQ